MDSFSEYKPYFDININNIVKQTMSDKELQAQMIRLNQEQLDKGLDSLGQRIESLSAIQQNSGYPYSMLTVKLRGEQGLQVDNVDLKDTGAFWDSMDVNVSDTETEIIADWNIHGEDIRENFSRNFEFLGLQDKKLNEFIQWYFLDLFEQLLKQSIIK